MGNALSLFQMSLRDLFQNAGAAFRITGTVYCVFIFIRTAIVLLMTGDVLLPEIDVQKMEKIQADLEKTGQVSPEALELYTSFMTFFLVNLLTLVPAVWLSVAWIRYKILDEESGMLLPSWNTARMLKYFGYSLLIGIALTVLFIFLVSVSGAIVTAIGAQSLASVFLLISFAIALGIYFRLSPMLSSASLDQSLTFVEAFERSNSISKACFYAALMYILVVLCLSTLNEFALGIAPNVIGLVISAAIEWALMILFASIIAMVHLQTENTEAKTN